MKMASEKNEELADLIIDETVLEWDDIKAKIPEMPTEELIEVMAELKLYVNKPLALEIARRKDAVFWLRKLIQDGQYWRKGGPGDAWSPIHAIHILALIKSKEALELLLDTMRYRGEDLGDWLTENVPSLLGSFGEDAIERLKEFTEDDTLESFVRGMCVTGLTVLARKYPSHKNGIKEHIIKLLNNTSDYTFASFIVDDLASFHDPSVMPEIRRAFEESRIEEVIISEEDVESIIKGEYDDGFKRHTEDPLNHFSRKSIEHLHSLHYPEPEEDYTEPEEDYFEPEMDVAKPKKVKIGRNEPCPCGSGKKYKKCCMGKERS